MQDKELTRPSVDPVSDILKWVLLVTAVICFALLGWATVLTYEKAPPHPQAFTDRAGNVLMSADDIVAGKGGFQKADLMDYGSIYGMGSYFGEDYTASTLVRLGVLTKQSLANSGATPPGTKAPGNKSLATTGPAGTPPEPTTPAAASPAEALSDAAVTATMQKQLQGIDLTQPTVVLPDSVAQAIRGLQGELTTKLNTVNLSAGWVPAKSLEPAASRSRPPISSSIRRSPPSLAGPGIRTRPGPRTGPTSRRSATRRRPTPSIGPGSASASPSSQWGSCCGSTGPISTIPTTRRWRRGLADLSRADAQPGQDRQIFPRRRAGVPRLARRGRDHGPLLL